MPLLRAAFSGLLRRLAMTTYVIVITRYAMTTHGTVIARYEAIQSNIVETSFLPDSNK